MYVKKSVWKKAIKEKIQENLEHIIRAKENEYRKLRLLKDQQYEIKSCINGMRVTEASLTTRRRLEMPDMGYNLGKEKSAIVVQGRKLST